MNNALIITVDGPSGSGKGTVSRRLAAVLGWHLLDSGALYRLTALAANRAGIALDHEDELAQIARNLDVEFDQTPDGEERILYKKQDVTRDIRSESCGEDASRVAVFPSVRDALVQAQRDFSRPPGLIADGRDMGTRIFVDAPLKVFLTASAAERAARRHKQLKDNDIDVSLAALLRDIEQRDHRDASRAVAPLVAAEDAITIDSTHLDADAVVSEILALKNARLGIG
ncbi:MAG: (d)CMP kinase [Pseudomonadota bacterium]